VEKKIAGPTLYDPMEGGKFLIEKELNMVERRKGWKTHIFADSAVYCCCHEEDMGDRTNFGIVLSWGIPWRGHKFSI
jgi:hypothetical protein